MNIELYFLRSSEHFIVKDLLRYAARLDESGDTLKEHPYLEQYHRNYGNFNGDIGVYAIVDNKIAGGAWSRMLLNGFGHVDAQTPELVFGVLPEFRNQGIGTQIINQLLNEIAKLYPQVSLAVREDNPAIKLYERLGFSKIAESEMTNTAGSISFKMIKTLEKEEEELSATASLEEERFRKSFQF
jgi:ribosomal protein S18 acetylase RimI-like enzyme